MANSTIGRTVSKYEKTDCLLREAMAHSPAKVVTYLCPSMPFKVSVYLSGEGDYVLNVERGGRLWITIRTEFLISISNILTDSVWFKAVGKWVDC